MSTGKIHAHVSHCFHRWLPELRGRAQQQPGGVKMDDAVVEARREEILPGDLLQGITGCPANHFDLFSYRWTRPAGHHRIISVPVTFPPQPTHWMHVIDSFGRTRPSLARVLCIVATKNAGKPIPLMTIFVDSRRSFCQVDRVDGREFSLRSIGWKKRIRVRSSIEREREREKNVFMCIRKYFIRDFIVSETLDSQVQ